MQIGPTLQSHIADMFINSGEAAYRVDTSRAQQMPDIPWRKVIGLRHILAHGYEQVAHEILFKTIADDLPTLEGAVLRALADA